MNDHEQFDIRNRETYKNKKILRLVYNNYFNLIKKNLFENSKYPILEIGSSGFIKEIIPNCITSNLIKNDPMIDREENIFNLNYGNEFYSNIILVDIFHHLRFPMLALKNLHRVLCNNGRVILIEPAMGLVPRVIYKIFHHEPNGFNFKINWLDNPNQIPEKTDYFAAQALSWRAFVNEELDCSDLFKKKTVNYFSDFAYLGSGGFSFSSMYPSRLYPTVKKIDEFLTKFAKNIFASRMIIVLEKKD